MQSGFNCEDCSVGLCCLGHAEEVMILGCTVKEGGGGGGGGTKKTLFSSASALVEREWEKARGRGRRLRSEPRCNILTIPTSTRETLVFDELVRILAFLRVRMYETYTLLLRRRPVLLVSGKWVSGQEIARCM